MPLLRSRPRLLSADRNSVLVGRFAAPLILAAVVLFPSPASADVTVGVDYGENWQGFMNVFNLDRSGGGTAPGDFQFGSGWGFNDLTAVFDEGAGTLTLGPNTIGDPDPYWYIGGGGPGALGNKWMDANGFVQVTDAYSGMTVTFEGFVQSNTLTGAHSAVAFIRDFAPDFSSFNEQTAAVGGGNFSLSLATEAGAGRHVQYGFNVQGENVWVTDVAPFGAVTITAIPEPGSLAFLSLCGCGMLVRRRRRS